MVRFKNRWLLVKLIPVSSLSGSTPPQPTRILRKASDKTQTARSISSYLFLLLFSTKDRRLYIKRRPLSPHLRQTFLAKLSYSPDILGSGGSRFVINAPTHFRFEARLRTFFNAPPALLFNSGSDANVGFFSGGTIRELQLDSTFETNGNKFEVYAALGELFGSGCPVGYLLVQSPCSSDGGSEGAKERFITKFLTHLCDKWNIRPATTLSDKDWSEINAFLAVYPNAKHQLCFWHDLRAVKTRLATLCRKPAHYDVNEARKEFPFIKSDFVPDAQTENPEQLYAKYPVAEDTIPHLKIRLNGHLQGQAEPSSRPALSIRLNGVLTSVVHIPESMHWEGDDESEDEDDGEGGGLRCERDFDEQVDRFIDDAEEDQLEGPDWQFDPEETVVPTVPGKQPYAFCGAPHRKQLLKPHTAHFCQHPFFAERREKEAWTAEKIRTNAVQELYLFCEQRGLREAWAYFWANWYSPQRWKLWARSSSPDILSRWRTTMAVENFWCQLKGNNLKNIPRPRIDHLIHILIDVITREYYARFSMQSKSWGQGTSKSPTTFQKYFKASWRKLEQRTIKTNLYSVDVEMWRCNCGQQKYNPYHLCKHLVKAVGPIPMRSKFWQEIRRRRRMPLYVHPLLQKTNTPKRGSITDGDDTDDDSEKSNHPSTPPTMPTQQPSTFSNPSPECSIYLYYTLPPCTRYRSLTGGIAHATGTLQ